MTFLGYRCTDQYGHSIWIKADRPVRKTLLDHLDRRHCQKMYVDDAKIGKSRHVGYIIDGLWITVRRVYTWK